MAVDMRAATIKGVCGTAELAAHDDEIEKTIAVGIGGMEATVVQGNGTEASHGTTMEDISMDERAAIVEGTETCQGELTVEDGSMDNGTTDADGAQARGAEGVSVAQNAELVGSNGSIDSGGIAGAGAQLGAAEDVGARTVGRGGKSRGRRTRNPGHQRKKG